MKRKGLLILSSLLICMATLCVGIYALVPLSVSGNFSCWLPEFDDTAWYIEGGTVKQTNLAYSTTTITYIRKSV